MNSGEAGPLEQRYQPLPNPFDAWADVYDDQSNPLLQLEHRYLARMLPAVHSLDILDAGCGTGRWLQTLAAQAPRSLTGVDTSIKMLAQAIRKLRDRAELLIGECAVLPAPSQSKDLILASFVISYLPDLDMFATECQRVCREDGDLFLTDMHPATAETHGWKRSFKAGDISVELETQSHHLPAILSCFEAHGFRLAALIEPLFGPDEQSLLSMRGKGDVIDAAAHTPPIYLLHLKRTQTPKERSATIARHLHLTGGRAAWSRGERICFHQNRSGTNGDDRH